MSEFGDIGGDIGASDTGADIEVDVGADLSGDVGADFGDDSWDDIGSDLADADIAETQIAEDVDFSDLEDADLSGIEGDDSDAIEDYDFSDEGTDDFSAEVDDSFIEDMNEEQSDDPFEAEETEKEFAGQENPFDEEGVLKPNIEYTTGEYDYKYKTDEDSRITSFQTDNLQLTEREERLTHNSKSLDKGELDDAGHLIGDRFGGSPELDNIVSQNLHINRSEYKTMENEWADAINNGSHVEVAGDLIYDDDSSRPSSFDVFYSIDDEVYEKSFTNY